MNLRRLMTPSDACACIAMAGILGGVVVGSTISGCTDPCEIASVVADKGDALLPEARQAVAKAAIMVQAMPDSKAKDVAIQALLDAADALQVAGDALDHARLICSAPDLPSIFRAFADAWTLLRPFVGTYGGQFGGISDPQAYLVGMQ